MRTMAVLAATIWASGICEAQEARVSDTHRVILRNGNMIDGVLRKKTDAGILLAYAPSIQVFIRWTEIRSVEEISIRTLRSEPRRIAPPNPEGSSVDTTPGVSGTPPKAPSPPDNIKLPEIPANLHQQIDDLLDRVRATPRDRRGRYAEELVALGPEAGRYMAVRMELLPDDLIYWTGSEIGRSGDRSLVPELRKRLASDRPVVRSVAIQLLQELRDIESAPRVERMLLDGEEGVRGAAAIALVDLGNESTVVALGQLMRDPSAAVRRVGLRAAVDLARRKARLAELVTLWHDHVRSLTGARREDVAAATGLLIPNLGVEENGATAETRAAVEEMLLDLATDREAPVRSAAYQSLGKLGGPHARETLIAALPEEKNEEALTSLITAVQESRDRGAIPELIERLDSSSSRVRDAAYNALKSITGEMTLSADLQEWRDWYGRK